MNTTDWDASMFEWLTRHFGNRVTEKEIRGWLGRNGYYGASAQFTEIELHAIKRPGWYQVFRFSAKAKSSRTDQWQIVHGILKGDERYRKNEIEIFDSLIHRDETLKTCCQGLIVRRSRQNRNCQSDTESAPDNNCNR